MPRRCSWGVGEGVEEAENPLDELSGQATIAGLGMLKQGAQGAIYACGIQEGLEKAEWPTQ